MSSMFARRLPGVHARYTAFQSSRAGKATGWTWKHRRSIATGLFITYFATGYLIVKNEARKRDIVHPNTYLYMKIYPGAIVEVKGPPNLSYLLSGPTAGEDPPRIMAIHDVIRTLQWAAHDIRVRGIFADFSTLNWPSNVQSEGLGLAQIEELMTAIHQFKIAKDEQYPPPEYAQSLKKLSEIEGTDQDDKDKAGSETVATPQAPHLPTTIAFADTFFSQTSYLLASTFDKVYLQPSGSLPLTGVSAQIPFFSRLLTKLGVRVQAEARKEYKSMISQFVEKDGLTQPQAENEAALLGELNQSLAYAIGVNRWPEMDSSKAADTVVELMQKGPYSAKEAEELGLIDGRMYKGDVAKLLLGDDHGIAFGDEPAESDQGDADSAKLHFKTLPHYFKICEYTVEKKLHKDEQANVAVCYLRGSISSAAGDFSASAVVKGLKEASEDKDVVAIVVRMDSGGGDVVASDSIWHAIKRAKETSGKPVIVSFGNIAASGSYYAATAADAIFASESTVTGSIGVASLKPTITRKMFDWAGVGVQTFFTGGKGDSSLHEMDAEQKKRHTQHVDEMYSDFLDKVSEGRGIPRDVVDELAGGRVYTGIVAFGKTHPSVFENAHADGAASTDAGDHDGLVRQAEKALGLVPSKVRPEAGSEDQPMVLDEWTLREATGPEELNTQVVVRKRPLHSIPTARKGAMPEGHKGHDGPSSQVAAVLTKVKDELASLPSSLNTDESAAASSLDPAEAAHREAKAAASAQKQSADEDATRHAQESQASASPYGLGLVDALGGMWEAAQFAMCAGLQREVDVYMEENKCDLQEALQKVRPGCQRETETEGNSIALSVDMRLVKYPRERTFTERIRELNKKGDSPSLSVLGPLQWLSPASMWVSFEHSMVNVVSKAMWNVAAAVSEDPQKTITQLARRADAGLKSQERAKMEYDGAGVYTSH
ncbi:unnamed protein product [Parajaminaea phylloscopi]